jgi:hypothetical protein
MNFSKNELLEVLPRATSLKLLRFINTDVKQFWRTIRSTLPQASEPIKEFAEQLPEIFTAIELDNDLRDRREVYLTIAQFLKDHLRQPLPICLNAVHLLCQEDNPLIQEDGAVGGEKLVEAAQNLLVIIQVHYEPQSGGIYNRKIEIYFLKEGSRKVKRIEDQLDWDDLPQHIRETHLSQQNIETKPVHLYPRKK